MFPTLFTATLSGLLLLTPAQGPGLAPEDSAITEAALRHHVKSVVGLEDRSVGGPGLQAAVDYVERHFDRAGLQSGKQELSLVHYSYSSPPRLVFELESGETYSGVCGIDFTLTARGLATSTDMLPIRSVSLLKKTVPDEDPASALFIEGSAQRKRRILKESALEDLSGFGLEIEAIADGKFAKPGKSETAPRGRTVSRSQLAAIEGAEKVSLRGELLRRFFVDAPVSVKLEVESELETVPASNVFGILPGQGPLAGEAVLVSARLDAPGGRVARDKRFVKSPAVDEATGLAAMLELVEALEGTRPSRTIVFLATCGLEHGRLGIDGYLDDPAFPLAKTVAQIHLDRLGRAEPRLESEASCVYMTGQERSDLQQLLKARGIAVASDPYPRAKLYARLGDLETGARGVLSHSLSSYPVEDAGGVILGVDAMDYANLLAGTETAFQVVRAIATGEVTPAWREGKQPKGIKGLLSGK